MPHRAWCFYSPPGSSTHSPDSHSCYFTFVDIVTVHQRHLVAIALLGWITWTNMSRWPSNHAVPSLLCLCVQLYCYSWDGVSSSNRHTYSKLKLFKDIRHCWHSQAVDVCYSMLYVKNKGRRSMIGWSKRSNPRYRKIDCFLLKTCPKCPKSVCQSEYSSSNTILFYPFIVGLIGQTNLWWCLLPSPADFFWALSKFWACIQLLMDIFFHFPVFCLVLLPHWNEMFWIKIFLLSHASSESHQT